MRREHGKRDRPRRQPSAARHERIGPVARLAAEEEAASEKRRSKFEKSIIKKSVEMR